MCENQTQEYSERLQNKDRTISRLVSEATLLALMTALAYSIAFFYEAGFLDAFGIPYQLARIETYTILIVLLSISGSLYLLFAVGNLIAMLWPVNPLLQDKIIRIIFMLILPIWWVLNYGIRREDLWFFLLILGLVALFEFIWPIIMFRGKKTLLEKFEADEIAEQGHRSRTLFGRLFSVVGPFFYVIILVSYLGCRLAFEAGRAKALTSKDFFVLDNLPDVAIVRVYPDLLIGLPFEKETKTVRGDLILMKVSENVMIRMSRINAGPLKVKQDKQKDSKKDFK